MNRTALPALHITTTPGMETKHSWKTGKGDPPPPPTTPPKTAEASAPTALGKEEFKSLFQASSHKNE